MQRDSFAFRTFAVGRKPYWSTNSADGRYCFVSASGDDGDADVLRYRARIHRGRWALREPLLSKAARGGHLSIQFTGDLRRRVRGEAISKAVTR